MMQIHNVGILSRLSTVGALWRVDQSTHFLCIIYCFRLDLVQHLSNPQIDFENEI